MGFGKEPLSALIDQSSGLYRTLPSVAHNLAAFMHSLLKTNYTTCSQGVKKAHLESV